MEIKFDCKYFKGAYPCKPNKQHDVTCDGCKHYSKPDVRILIIKLGAIGDVIRTTPLLVKYNKLYKNPHITWITHSPDVLPDERIDEICKFDYISISKVLNKHYDIAINLDKDEEACILLKDVFADKKFGFIWKNNHIDAATEKAKHKLITGIFDNISKSNTKNYLEEIFEICHFQFKGEPYLLNYDKELAEKWQSLRKMADGKKLIGLNTGCGTRWLTRLWPDQYWIDFIKILQKENCFPVLLGGKDEDIKNRFFAKKTDAFYPGTFSLKEFIALTSNLDLIVSHVTMMMHIAIGLKIPLVLMNNIFNRHEFELYNNGVIVEPTSGCDCYFGNTCKRDHHCMNDLIPEKVFEETKKLLTKV
ncbi:MAG: glycosyltransferase family 9 protein [Bacteroidota bacterium]